MRRIITAVLLGSLCFGVAQAQSNINGGDAKQVGDTIVTHLGDHTLYIPKGYVSSIMGFAGTVEIHALLPCLLPETPESVAEFRAPLEGKGFGRILTADLTAYSDMPHRVGQALLDERIKLSAFAKSGQEYSKFNATYDPKHRDPSIGPYPVPNSKFVVYDDALLGRDIFVLPGSDPLLVLDCTRWDKFVVSPECVSVERAPGDLHVKYNYSRSFVENDESAAIDTRLQHLLASFLTPTSTTKQACE